MFSAPAGQNRLEHATWVVCALGGLGIVLSLLGATWATLRYQAENHWVGQETAQMQAAPDFVAAVPAAASYRTAVVPTQARPMQPADGSFAMLGWNDLTLMLRTGLSDEEVIAAASGKQMVVAVGPEQERVLRGLGAGNRLMRFLRSQPVYDAPQNYPVQQRVVVNAAAPPAATPPPRLVPVVAPAIDYAARDQKIAQLKRQIDDLDEQMRVVRTNPKDNRYWWHYSSRYGIDQRQHDAYMKQIDDERNDLRRQKWQLEGR